MQFAFFFLNYFVLFTYVTDFTGDAIYQTVLLTNSSNLPSTFRFQLGWEGDSADVNSKEFSTCSDGIFSIKPVAGEIAAEDFVLICIRFQPLADKKYTTLLRAIVNSMPSGKVLLEGTGGFPCVRMIDIQETIATVTASIPPRTQSAYTRLPASEGALTISLRPGGQVPSNLPNGFQGSFYLKPTSVGLSSTRMFTLKNTSRLPVKFTVTLPESAVGILCVTPINGSYLHMKYPCLK